MMYEIIVRAQARGDFRGIVAQIPGVVGYGATPGQALDATYQALTAALQQRGQVAPTWQVVRADLAGNSRT